MSVCLSVCLSVHPSVGLYNNKKLIKLWGPTPYTEPGIKNERSACPQTMRVGAHAAIPGICLRSPPWSPPWVAHFISKFHQSPQSKQALQTVPSTSVKNLRNCSLCPCSGNVSGTSSSPCIAQFVSTQSVLGSKS